MPVDRPSAVETVREALDLWVRWELMEALRLWGVGAGETEEIVSGGLREGGRGAGGSASASAGSVSSAVGLAGWMLGRTRLGLGIVDWWWWRWGWVVGGKRSQEIWKSEKTVLRDSGLVFVSNAGFLDPQRSPCSLPNTPPGPPPEQPSARSLIAHPPSAPTPAPNPSRPTPAHPLSTTTRHPAWSRSYPKHLSPLIRPPYWANSISRISFPILPLSTSCIASLVLLFSLILTSLILLELGKVMGLMATFMFLVSTSLSAI